jgi:hypothetical protein
MSETGTKDGEKKGKTKNQKGPREKKKSRAVLRKEAELERIAKEAKVAEEKELAIKAEQDRLKAEEDARLAEEHRVRKIAESKRLNIQIEEDLETLQLRRENMRKLFLKAKQLADWEYHTQCSDLPDVTREGELEAYKSLWREPLVGVELDPIAAFEPVIIGMTRAEAVVQSLSRTTGHAHEQWDFKMLDWAREFTDSLYDESAAKLDVITRHYLQKADDYQDEVRAVAQESFGTKDIHFGIWVHTNGNNNQGGRKITFENIGVNIQLKPAELGRTRNCIRFLYTSYDHLCGTLRLANKPKQQKKTLNPWKEEEKGEEKVGRLSGLDCEIAMVSLGGVIHVQQLAVPPLSKKAKLDEIHEVTEHAHSVVDLPYPSERSEAKEDGEEEEEQLPVIVTYTAPDFIITVDGPPLFGWWDAKDKTWCLDGIEPDRYEVKDKNRSGTGKRVMEVVVKIKQLKPFAMIQFRALDFPYRSWSIRPISHEAVMLRLRGSRFTVELELKNGKAALREPRFEVLQDQGLQDTFLPPGVLLMRLARTGLNIMPNDDDSKFTRKPLRAPGLEPYLHEQISMVAHCFEIKGSPFNCARPSHQTLFCVRINNQLDEVLIGDIEAKEEQEKFHEMEAKKEKDPNPAPDDSDDDSASAVSAHLAPAAPVEDNMPPFPESDDEGSDEPEGDDAKSEHGQMSGFESDLLMGFVGKHKKKRKTVRSWVPILAGKDIFSVVETDQRGVVKGDPEYECTHSQSSLRRLLAAHYAKFRNKGQVSYNLPTAFQCVDERESTQQLQECLQRALNLVRTLVFY